MQGTLCLIEDINVASWSNSLVLRLDHALLNQGKSFNCLSAVLGKLLLIPSGETNYNLLYNFVLQFVGHK